MTAPIVHVIHDNPEWIAPFARAFDDAGLTWDEWLLGEPGTPAIDLGAEPPEGVYWSRLSASSHTRGRAGAKEQGRAILAWLESWGRTVVNGSAVLALEVSKIAQHGALRRAGFDVPATTAVFDRSQLVAAASALPVPFITKHNQGGKGLGVRRFDDHETFAEWARSGEDPSIDGIILLQELLVAEAPFVTRAEFVDGAFVYAVRVDTSAGSFELCPADACAVPGADGAEPEPLFRLREGVDASFLDRLAAFLTAEGIDVAGVEFIETTDGRRVVYDVNTNTNYNPDVEASAPVSAPARIAQMLAARAGQVPAAV